jgi:hypothetical protein
MGIILWPSLSAVRISFTGYFNSGFMFKQSETCINQKVYFNFQQKTIPENRGSQLHSSHYSHSHFSNQCKRESSASTYI